MSDSNKNNRLRRNRYRLSKKSKSDCRLSVFRSNKHIYAQIIDDKNHKTLFSSSTLDSDLKLKNGSTKESAFKVGEKIGLIAKEKGYFVPAGAFNHIFQLDTRFYVDKETNSINQTCQRRAPNTN